MEEEKDVVADNSKTEEETDLDTVTEDVDEQEKEESPEELKARLAKAEELAKNYKIRAEKAERASKSSKEEAPRKSNNGDLTTKDLYALMEAKVPQDDIEEVAEYAKLKKISIAEALKSNVVKSILNDNAEKRTSASVANTGTTRRSNGKLSDEAFLESVKSGKLPETDEDMLRYAKLRSKR